MVPLWAEHNCLKQKGGMPIGLNHSNQEQQKTRVCIHSCITGILLVLVLVLLDTANGEDEV